MTALPLLRHIGLRLASVLVIGGVCAASAPGGVNTEKNSPVFQIEIPEARLGRSHLAMLYLQTREISQVVLYVLRPQAADIAYGKIFPFVNGAAASVITQMKASQSGKKLILSLDMRPGFRLLPGFNVVSVRAFDKRGSEFRATFVLHTPKGACAHGSAKLLGVDDLGDLLRAGVSNLRLTTLVLDCGLDFQARPAIEEQLRELGAQHGLIRTIEDPMEAAQQGKGSIEMSVGDVLYLLEQHAPSQDLVGLVASRGVNFELDHAIEAKLRAAGATDALLEALRSARQSR